MSDEEEMFVLVPSDIGQLIAAETSGIKSARPDQEDFDLAAGFIELINSDDRYQGNSTTHKLVWSPK